MSHITFTEWLVNNMPPVDIIHFIDDASLFATKFLFYYAPLLTGLIVMLKGIQNIFRGIKLCNMSKHGKYHKGTIVAKHRENGEFFETGRLFLFAYPVVEYKSQGETWTCIANKPGKVKIGDSRSVYVCKDGDEHLMAPGLFTIALGIVIIVLGILLTVFVNNTLNIFLY